MKKALATILTAAMCITVAASCSKCGESSDAAKKEAFEKKAVSEQVVQEFNPVLFGTDPAVRDRMVSMTFSEAVRRMGDVSFRQSYRVEWYAPGKMPMVLSGEDQIEQNAAGEYHMKGENDSGYGVEAIFAGGKLYVRGKGAGYHEQPIEKGESGALREEAWGALKSWWDLVEGRVTLHDAGTAVVSGRQARKYEMTAQEGAGAPKQKKEGAAAKAKGAADQGLADMALKSAKGAVYVDERAKAVVKTELKAEMTGGTVLVKVSFDNEISPRPEVKITRPEVVSEPQRQKVEKDPLGKLEGRKGEGEKGAQGAQPGGKKDGEGDGEETP